MRLYYSILSNKDIMYVPSTLRIDYAGKEYMYDINGDIDCGISGGRVKGELSIMNDDGEFVEMTEEDERFLDKLLQSKAHCVLAIYPFEDSADVSNDEILGASMSLMYKDSTYDIGNVEAEIIDW